MSSGLATFADCEPSKFERMQITRKFLLFALAFCLNFLLLKAQPATLPTAVIDSIEQHLQHEIAKQKIPALSVAVLVDGKLAWSKGYGLADVENEVPALAQTKYRIASVGKLFTATAVMRLEEQGRLSIDSTIQVYCPAFPDKRWKVTVRDLLCHQGGIRHYRTGVFGIDREEFYSNRHYTSTEETLHQFKDDSLLFEPGSRYSYSTYAYNLLGCIVEGAASVRYEDYVEKELFSQAGMANTLPDDPFAIISRRSQGYFLEKNGELKNCRMVDMTNKIPGGGFLSTAEDLVLFCAATMNGRFFSKKTLEKMLTHQKLNDGKLTSHGLGWGLNDADDPFHGERQAMHGGATPGVTCYLLMLPDRNFAVAVLTNLEGVQRRGQMCERIAELVLNLKR
jgi:CubicO group peptidase (beta-lactamase class C family)